MTDINQIIKNTHATHTSDPQRADRELDLQNWDEEQAREIARQEGIQLGDDHWEVVHFLRDHYLEHGLAKNGRELSEVLDNEFAAQGGRKYLRQLFPKGPVAQGMQIAGLEAPPYTRDKGLGVNF